MSTNTSLSSQVQIDNKEIEEMLSNLFPTNTVLEIRYLSYAYTNKTALVRLKGKNDKVVIKICVKEDRFPKLELETNLIERISAETDLPVPKILYKDLSMKKFSYPFVVYSFLPGENLADSIIHIEDKVTLGTELGKIASQLHKITFGKPQFSLAERES